MAAIGKPCGGRWPIASPVCEMHHRILMLDRLRGLVIVLMVLDHVREFFNRDALLFVAEDLGRTTPLIFATRWVTHLCAPTFVLLAGVSVRLQQDGGKTGWRLTRFLAARGAWLIVLELTVVSLMFNFGWPFLFLQAIWAIGAAMMLMAGAVWLPRRAVLGLGLAIVIGGQALAPLNDPALLGACWPWTLLMNLGVLPFVPSFVAYPAIPWFGVMAVGYGAGNLFLMPPRARDHRLIGIGFFMLASFVAIRMVNGYGNPTPWTAQSSGIFTFLSFMNVGKYPPGTRGRYRSPGANRIRGDGLPSLAVDVCRVSIGGQTAHRSERQCCC